MATDVSLSAGKALEVFRFLCEAERPCSAATIAKETGFPRTVALRMIATLERYDFVERDEETGLLAVNPLVLHQVQKGLLNNPVLSRVDRILQDFAQRTGDGAIYVIPSGDKAVVINRVEGSAEMQVRASEVGMELPLHCGGAPLAILAHSSEAFIENYLASPLVRRTDATVTDPVRLRAIVQTVRENGYAVGNCDLFEFLVAVGAPVFDHRGDLAGAVSVGNIVQRFPPERIKEVGKILVEATRRF